MDTRQPASGTGQPITDFLLPPENGVSRTFYEAYCGRPAAVIRCSRTALLQPFADLAGRHQLLGLLPSGQPPENALPFPAMTEDGRIAHALGLHSPAESTAMILSPTLRVMERIDNPTPQLVDDMLGQHPEPQTGPVVSATAPVLMVPDLIPPTLCRELMAAHDADHTESGMVRLRKGHRQLVADGTVKRRRDHLLKDERLVAALRDVLLDHLVPAIARAFHYRITRFEGFKVVAYDALQGGYFRRHRDNISADTRHRRFALSLNLNDGYRGGCLIFPEFGPTRYRPPAGGAIVFSGTHLHEATEVTDGRRYVLLTFLWGEDAVPASRQPDA